MRTVSFALALLAATAAAACAQAPADDSPDYELSDNDVTSNESTKRESSVKGEDDDTGSAPPEAADRTSSFTPSGSGAAAAPFRDGTYAIVDGEDATVTATKVDPIDANRNIVTLTISGKTAPAGSELRILLQKTTEGCVGLPLSVSQRVLYFPGGTSDQFRSPDGATCGLTVAAYATKKGEATRGTFRGAVEGLGTQEGKSHQVEIGFQLTRTSDPPPPPPCVKTGYPMNGGTCCSGKAAYNGSMLLCQ